MPNPSTRPTVLYYLFHCPIRPYSSCTRHGPCPVASSTSPDPSSATSMYYLQQQQQRPFSHLSLNTQAEYQGGSDEVQQQQQQQWQQPPRRVSSQGGGPDSLPVDPGGASCSSPGAYPSIHGCISAAEGFLALSQWGERAAPATHPPPPEVTTNDNLRCHTPQLNRTPETLALGHGPQPQQVCLLCPPPRLRVHLPHLGHGLGPAYARGPAGLPACIMPGLLDSSHPRLPP